MGKKMRWQGLLITCNLLATSEDYYQGYLDKDVPVLNAWGHVVITTEQAKFIVVDTQKAGYDRIRGRKGWHWKRYIVGTCDVFEDFLSDYPVYTDGDVGEIKDPDHNLSMFHGKLDQDKTFYPLNRNCGCVLDVESSWPVQSDGVKMVYMESEGAEAQVEAEKKKIEEDLKLIYRAVVNGSYTFIVGLEP